ACARGWGLFVFRAWYVSFCVVQGENKTPLHRKNSVQGQEILWCHLACRARVCPGGAAALRAAGSPGPVTGANRRRILGQTPFPAPSAIHCAAPLPPRSQLRGLSVGAARGFTFASTVSEKIIALPRRLVKRAGGRGVIPPLPPARGRSSTARRW